MTEVEYKDSFYQFWIYYVPSFPLWYVAIEPMNPQPSKAHLTELFRALTKTSPESWYKPYPEETFPAWSTLQRAKKAVEQAFAKINPRKRWGLLTWDGQWHRG